MKETAPVRWMKKFISEIIIISFICALGFLIFDRVLGFLGFPSDILIQYSHPKNFKEKRTNIEFEYHFETNDQGLRYKKIPLEKPDNEIRIFLVGDSFTEGCGVESNEVFNSLLEDHFSRTQTKKVRFINGGLRGTGPLQYWRAFNNIGLKYEIDGLLICLYANDVSDIPKLIGREDPFLLYSDRHGIKKILHKLYPRIYSILNKVSYRYRKVKNKKNNFVKSISNRALKIGISSERIRQWQKNLPEKLVSAIDRGEFNGVLLSYSLLRPQYWTDALDIDTNEAERKYRSLVNILDMIIRKAMNKGIEVALLFIPAPFQYDPSIFESWKPFVKAGLQLRKHWLLRKTGLQKRIEKWVKKKRMPFLDLTKTFRGVIQRNQNLNWRLDGHWTPEGHRVAGRAIHSWIENERVFPSIRY